MKVYLGKVCTYDGCDFFRFVVKYSMMKLKLYFGKMNALKQNTIGENMKKWNLNNDNFVH